MRDNGYIPRHVEGRVLHYVDEVLRDGSTKAVLLYGAGGVGKTRMLRDLARREVGSPAVRWVEPIDVDDPEYWVLENLQRRIARVLDPDDRYFKSFHEYLSRLPGDSDGASHETIASHHQRLREEFVRCYQRLVEVTGTTVVIALDTVEVIRDSNFPAILSQWMPKMPRTLFVLSGRPAEDDPITRLLADEVAEDWIERIEMPGFTPSETRKFLAQSVLGGHLEEGVIDGLVALTEGHPLWLELAVDYLCDEEMPPELAERPPYLGRVREEFRRRLVSPFRRTEFWSEAVNRLAVVRHNVNRSTWAELMDDCRLPEGVADWDEAWAVLRDHPWIRSRANGQDVTLHDVLAQELALRLIPLHDQDEAWRRGLWRKAARIFGDATAQYQEVVDAIDAAPLDDLDSGGQRDRPAATRQAGHHQTQARSVPRGSVALPAAL